MSTKIDLEQVIESAPFGRVAWLVLVLTTLTLIFDGFDIQAIAFAAPSLFKEWGIHKADLSGVLAWGLGGMAFGALVVGEIGDRYGRRGATIIALAVIAVATFFAARATGLQALALWRCIAGIGLGGALPNAAALILEFANQRTRNLAVAVTVVGVPVGGMLGAAVAAQMVPVYGWRSIFVVGAVLPALLAVSALFWLPESPRFLAMQSGAGPRLARLMNRVVGAVRFTGSEAWLLADSGTIKHGVRELFRPEYFYNTVMIWLVFLTNVLTVYSFFNWTPALLAGAGLALGAALKGSLYFNLGGVIGAMGGAWCMNRWGSRLVLGVLGAVGVLSVFALGQAPIGPALSLWLLFGLIGVAGACISGLQVNMYTVCASAYPTHLRATGVGAGLANARFGGILSAYTGTFLMGLGGGLSTFFTGLSAVLVLTWVAALLMRCHLPPSVRR
ncbi:MAG: MFS transporter [Pseudomonadota bacterium]|jgi:AAHS family 4-hydroxybenzoate transporter-like MFS transporter